jgi:short-subunit dehydrogenase
MKNKIWLITGISSGLGKAIAQTVIENGDYVIGTFRSRVQADFFNDLYRDRAFALPLDISKPLDIENAFKIIQEKFGRIDVLVNNAGIGFAGAVEESSTKEVRELFEVNFFGALLVTQTFLPMFREQKSGHIIQISSHGGFKAFPGFGIYNASKFALEGFSEALASELDPCNVKLTIVEPGPFRTNFAGSSLRFANKIIEDYNPTSGLFRERIKKIDGNQEGDPIKASLAIFEISKLENPPLRLPLGKIALDSITTKLKSMQQDIDRFRELAEKCVF